MAPSKVAEVASISSEYAELDGTLSLQVVHVGEAIAFRTGPGLFLTVVSRGGVPKDLLSPSELLVKSVPCEQPGPPS
eukprot:1985729-Prymnesium_polylepis.1